MLLRKSMRAGIYFLPWHSAGTLPCRIEYCLASLGVIFCLSDTSCLFYSVFSFSWGGEARHLNLTENNKATAELQETFFLQLGKRSWTSAVAWNTFLCICVCVMFKCYMWRVSGSLKSTESKEKDIWSWHIALALRKSCGHWDFRGAVRFIYPRLDVCLHEQTLKKACHWFIGICRFTKQSDFIKRSLPQCLCITYLLICVLSIEEIDLKHSHYSPLFLPPYEVM